MWKYHLTQGQARGEVKSVAEQPREGPEVEYLRWHWCEGGTKKKKEKEEKNLYLDEQSLYMFIVQYIFIYTKIY